MPTVALAAAEDLGRPGASAAAAAMGQANNGGAGGNGGDAAGGGLLNLSGGIVSITAPRRSRSPAASLFRANVAVGGGGGAGGGAGDGAGDCHGGDGGDVSGAGSVGGLGNSGNGSTGGTGGAAGSCDGGGLTNAGTVSFTGVTVNFTANEVAGKTEETAVTAAADSAAMAAAEPRAATAATAPPATAATAATAAAVPAAASPTCRRQAHHRAQVGREEGLQAVESHERHHGQPGRSRGRELPVAPRESAMAGAGGSPNGAAGLANPGNAGATALSGTGIGGGLDLLTGGTVSIDNTTITGNTAATSNNDVIGTFTM